MRVPEKVSPINAAVFIFVVNVIYCVVLLYSKESNWFHVWNKDIISHFAQYISPDTATYLQPGPLRTIGYGYVLRFFMLFDSWIFYILIFNCMVSAWMFYVTHQLIGNKAWILAILGAFTIHVPMLLTDLLFAAVFVTSIWQIKKRLWLHFLLIGVASLIRPSLAWFFLIEPIVLYYYGYRGRIVILSGLIVFAVTAFTPLRNLIMFDQWTHSTVLDYNISMMRDSELPLYLYLINSFKINCLEGHPAFLHKAFYGNGFVGSMAMGINFLLILVNLGIWTYYLLRLRSVNIGNLLMVIYFIGPSLFAPAGARIRLPIEWILLL